MKTDSNKRKLISLVIPVYNESEVIDDTINFIERGDFFNSYDFEIVIVDDGSRDQSWTVAVNAAKKYDNIYAVSFSRNFGKEAAILAGLEYSRGDAVITMDADLQHPPGKIPDFISKWEQGNKIVEGKKIQRGKESVFQKGGALIFYKVLSSAIHADMERMSDFKLLDRDVVDVILALPEKQMFYRAISTWVGYTTDYVDYNVAKREKGTTKWNYKKLIKYAISNITSFTSAPLQIITVLGICFFVLAIVLGIITILRWLTGTAVEGFTTVILLQLISGAFIMLAIGIEGYYIGKLADDIRDRPRYIIEKEFGRKGRASHESDDRSGTESISKD